ncbi:MAG: DUF3830 family protein [Candidatus Bathyarchaeota archaeon]|nr:MAG: DUF3830 family protein [Candidatus Bathyarchaeota archaeon]
MRKIKIRSQAIGDVLAELYDDKNPKTAKAIWSALPLKGSVNTWGDEIYFSIAVDIGRENPQQVVEKGEIGYWPPGQAFCIFFGPTPASVQNEIRAASPVNVFGKVANNPDIFKKVQDGDEIIIEKAS